MRFTERKPAGQRLSSAAAIRAGLVGTDRFIDRRGAESAHLMVFDMTPGTVEGRVNVPHAQADKQPADCDSGSPAQVRDPPFAILSDVCGRGRCAP